MLLAASVLMIALSLGVSGEKRAPGDIIVPRTCTSVVLNGANLPVCYQLTEGDSCALWITVDVNGVEVARENLGTDVTATTCYASPLAYPCTQECVNLVPKLNDPSQVCAKLLLKCPGGNQTKNLGCFPKSNLDRINTCVDGLCPNACSSHGTCNNGFCRCNAGFYGDDCSSTTPQYFERCERVPALLNQEMCLHVEFSGCDVLVSAQLARVTVFQQTYSGAEFKNQVLRGQLSADAKVCLPNPPSACSSVCFELKDLTIQDSPRPLFKFCPLLNAQCILPYSKDFGCVNNTGDFARCMLQCPSSCSGHGTCVQGFCHCDGSFSGVACDMLPCPNDCSGQGTCLAGGICKCNDDFEGSDCATPFVTEDSSSRGESSSSKNGASAGVIVAVVLGSIVLLAAIVGGVWFFRMRQANDGMDRPRFSRLDLQADPDNDDGI